MPHKVVILGGGITGLTSAWYLEHFLREEVEVTVIEKSGRLGGCIHTVNEGNFLFEKGPRSLRPHSYGGIALELIESLKLQDEVIASSPFAKNRYVWDEGHLLKAPTGILEVFSSPLTKGFIGTFFKEWFRKKKTKADESIFDFFSRRYSSTLAKKLVDPLVACIYGGDIHQLSVQACFPILKEWEEQHGSVLSGAVRQVFCKRTSSTLISFKNGMESLPSRLAMELKGTIALNSEVERLTSSSVILKSGKELSYDSVISTLPGHALGKITRIPEITLPSGSITVVNMGWNRKVLNNEGFGCVIPSYSQLPLLGIVWDSSTFPQQNHHPDQTRITLMLGGSHSPTFSSLGNQDIQKTCLELTNSLLGISLLPDNIHIGHAINAIPHFPVGHRENTANWKKILKDFYPHLWLAGPLCEGAAVPQCLQSARNIALCVTEFAKKSRPI